MGLNLTTVTDANGKYLFDDLPTPGIYALTVILRPRPPGCDVILPNCPLTGLNTQNGVAETFVINVTSDFQVKTQILDAVAIEVAEGGIANRAVSLRRDRRDRG